MRFKLPTFADDNNDDDVAVDDDDDVVDDDDGIAALLMQTKPAPLGQFALDGKLFYEADAGNPYALQDVCFTLAGWVHAAVVVESLRMHSVPVKAMQSLWWLRHDGEDASSADPVLLKAIKWLAQFLPSDAKAYTSFTKLDDIDFQEELRRNGGKSASSSSTSSMTSQQQQQKQQRRQRQRRSMIAVSSYDALDSFNGEFAFDRMLDIVQRGVDFYGATRVFPLKDASPPNVKLFLSIDRYRTDLATMTKYSSVDPLSGSQIWGALGHYSRDIQHTAL